MWRYDGENFDPAAPVVEVEMKFGGTSAVTVQMQIDSGADLTCIPRRLVPASEDLPYGRSLVAGYSGEIVVRRTYFVSIRMNGYGFEDLEVLPIDDDVGLVGRDILNSLEVTLNGPAQEVLIDGE